jgi:hypothetical protein
MTPQLSNVTPSNPPHEEVVNVCLADILGQMFGEGNVVAPERMAKATRKRFDVRVDYKGLEIILEASYNRADAVEDAKRRLEEGLIETVAIAVYYDETHFALARTSPEIKVVLHSSEMELKVFSKGADISGTLIPYVRDKLRLAEEQTEWLRIKVNDFPQLLDLILEFLVTEDLLAGLTEEIERKTLTFINHVSETSRRLPNLMKKLYSVLFSSSGDEEGVALDVPADVVIAHTYISLLMASMLYDSVGPGHELDSMQRILSMRRNHPLLAMKEAFLKILKIDYEPVFDVAVALTDCLFDLQTDMMVMQDLREVIETAQYILVNRALLRSDFIGHLYHKVTGNIATRKGYATFYTKAPISYFLGSLALHLPNDSWTIEWSNLDSIREDFKVCDFACGSGTLISGSYMAMLSLSRRACLERDESLDLAQFHRTVLSNCVWGFDALEHAVQTASVVLNLHEPGVPLKKMLTYHVPVDNTGSIGSLNFWWSDKQFVPIRRRDVQETTKEEVVVPPFDIIIMNPPFSRATAPGVEDSRPRIFDFVSSPVAFKKLWDNYSELVRHIESTWKNKQGVNRFYEQYVGENRIFIPRNVDPLYAGAALPFFFLADQYLKPGGRLALVLPRTAIEGSSFFLLRSALLSNYDLNYVVISSQEGMPNFSYSTQFSEVLLVSTKRKKGDRPRDSQTYIVNFRRQPKDVLGGVLVARELLKRTPSVGSREKIEAQYADAEIHAVGRDVVEDFAWNLAPILGLPPWITKIMEQMVQGRLLGLPMKLRRVMDLPEMRITNPRKFRGKEFGALYSSSMVGNLRLLNKTGKGVLTNLQLDLARTVRISPKTADATKFYAQNAGRLLIPEAIRFNTAPLLATWCEQRIVSSRAHMLEAANSTIEKALCAWMNTSFAIVWLRALFTTVQEEFGHIYGWHIRTIKIPDISNDAIACALEGIFNKYSETLWSSLPEQYQKQGTKLRMSYDLDVLKALSEVTRSDFDEKEGRLGLTALYSELSSFL